MKLIDITPTITEDIAVFPGDQKYTRNTALDMSEAAHLTLSSMTTTMHLGAHADAPCHYERNGKGIEAVDVSRYVGHCQVISVSSLGVKGRILPEHIKKIKIESNRVLFYTGSFDDPDRWTNDFVALSPELIWELHKMNVILVGIDTPSVDPATSKSLESHQALKESGMSVLEGLFLKGVSDGNYVLLATPLKLSRSDASPVRACLIPLTEDIRTW